jgi:hypothetical protein
VKKMPNPLLHPMCNGMPPLHAAELIRSAEKKGVPLGTPPDLCAVSRPNRLLQRVDAGAEVDVKGCSVHH